MNPKLLIRYLVREVSGLATMATMATSALLSARTALEDRTLQAELAGYAAYAEKVRYRLIPGVR